jgi:hypothetical protein
MKRALIVGVLVLLTTSCRVTGPGFGIERGDPADTLTLRLGETVVWNGIDIGFTRVVEDNRCPVDVQCFWEGNAAVEIAVGPLHGGRGPTFPLILNTSLEPHAGEAWGVRVQLLDVRPQPISTQDIPPDAYVVRLSVSRVGR